MLKFKTYKIFILSIKNIRKTGKNVTQNLPKLIFTLLFVFSMQNLNGNYNMLII